jgi:DNA polymerase-3 subunit alpha
VLPSHAPIPQIEFERAELLAAEKEALGLFISAHPFKDVRAALSTRVDCSLAELSAKRDGEWVTVGGMIVQAKRIRTKKGDPMVFATLDDLEASVEVLVFGNALAAAGAAGSDAGGSQALAADSIVLVRGRVDHKDREKTCVVAQQVELFEPSPEELAQATAEALARAAPPAVLRLKLDARMLPGPALAELKDLLAGFPGEAEVVIELRTSAGCRCLKLGPKFRVKRSASLHAELDALLGSAIVHEEPKASLPADGLSPVPVAEPVAASA